MNATKYFYPGGWWGGYARFFSTCISGKHGERLIRDIRAVLMNRDALAFARLKIMFASPPPKRVCHIKGVPPKIVECSASPEASTALSLLREALAARR